MTLTVEASDVIQIAILYLVFYAILKSAKGSRFGQALMGIAILFALLIAFTQLFDFKVLSAIIRWLLIYLAVSSVVIFQPEIRRALAAHGAILVTARRRGNPANASPSCSSRYSQSRCPCTTAAW